MRRRTSSRSRASSTPASPTSPRRPASRRGPSTTTSIRRSRSSARSPTTQEAALTAPPTDDGTNDGAGQPSTPFERILRANRLYLERYRDNSRIMGVIEEVSRYDDHVSKARMRRQKHFADRAERAIRRWQAEGASRRRTSTRRSPRSPSGRWSAASPSCGSSRTGRRSTSIAPSTR